MHFLPLARLFEMAAVSSDRLAGGASGEQAQEYAQVFLLWNNLLKTHAGNVNVGQMRAHIGITFVGRDYKTTCFGHGKIDARQCGAAG
ncbi:hypothetical protein D3C87_1877200 [compost metagenome]